jgi:hypothetical protein
MSWVRILDVLVTFLGDDVLFRHLGSAGEKAFKACATHNGKCLCFPQ